MYITIPMNAMWAVLVLVLCAIVCTGVLIQRVKRAATAARKNEDKAAHSDAIVLEQKKTITGQQRELDLRCKVIDDLQARINGLEGSLAAREAEVSRLQRLVTKAEQDAKDARDERDKQTNRANDESTARMNTQADLARARTGEDPETDTFYAEKYAVHIAVGLDADTVAAVAAESDSGAAAETPAEDVAPAEAEAQPKTTKKPRPKK